MRIQKLIGSSLTPTPVCFANTSPPQKGRGKPAASLRPSSPPSIGGEVSAKRTEWGSKISRVQNIFAYSSTLLLSKTKGSPMMHSPSLPTVVSPFLPIDSLEPSVVGLPVRMSFMM